MRNRTYGVVRGGWGDPTPYSIPTKLSEFPYWLLPSDALEYEADQELLGPNLPVRNAPEGPFLKFSLFKSAH